MRESCLATSASAGSSPTLTQRVSHTGVVAIENGEPVVYDTTKMGVACQPFGVWILDNVGALGIKRLRPEHRGAVPKVLAYCHKVFQQQVPFDYELGPDDSKLYCVEMTEKAFARPELPFQSRLLWATWSAPMNSPSLCSACNMPPGGCSTEP